MSRSVRNEGGEFITASDQKLGRFAVRPLFLAASHYVTDGTGTRFLSERTYSSGVTLVRRGFVALRVYDLYDDNLVPPPMAPTALAASLG